MLCCKKLEVKSTSVRSLTPLLEMFCCVKLRVKSAFCPLPDSSFIIPLSFSTYTSDKRCCRSRSRCVEWGSCERLACVKPRSDQGVCVLVSEIDSNHLMGSPWRLYFCVSVVLSFSDAALFCFLGGGAPSSASSSVSPVCVRISPVGSSLQKPRNSSSRKDAMTPLGVPVASFAVFVVFLVLVVCAVFAVFAVVLLRPGGCT